MQIGINRIVRLNPNLFCIRIMLITCYYVMSMWYFTWSATSLCNRELFTNYSDRKANWNPEAVWDFCLQQNICKNYVFLDVLKRGKELVLMFLWVSVLSGKWSCTAEELKYIDNSVVWVRQPQSGQVAPSCGFLPTCWQHYISYLCQTHNLLLFQRIYWQRVQHKHTWYRETTERDQWCWYVKE